MFAVHPHARHHFHHGHAAGGPAWSVFGL